MAKKISQLGQLLRTAIASGDKIPILDESAGQTKYVTVGDLVGIPDIGWTAAGEAWAYNAWDSTLKRGTLTVPTDATTKYSPGMYVKFTQSTGGTKFGRIISVTSTTMVIYLGSQTLNNEAITLPFYSGESQPIGLPTYIRNYHPYKFRAYRNGNYSFATGTNKISLNAESYDSNGNFDSTTNFRYTAPVDGFYSFSGQIRLSASNGNAFGAVLFKNGAQISLGPVLVMAAAFDQGFNVTDILQLSAGDYIELYLVNGDAGSRTVIGTATQTYLAGHLISEGVS